MRLYARLDTETRNITTILQVSQREANRRNMKEGCQTIRYDNDEWKRY